MKTKAAARKTSTAKATVKTSTATPKPPELFYRINSLLYTLRTIAQREDQLCVLMHHLRTSGKLNAELAAELEEIVDDIPTDEYLEDVRALRGSLQSAMPTPERVVRPRVRRAESRA